jgi:hypothetical protein
MAIVCYLWMSVESFKAPKLIGNRNVEDPGIPLDIRMDIIQHAICCSFSIRKRTVE